MLITAYLASVTANFVLEALTYQVSTYILENRINQKLLTSYESRLERYAEQITGHMKSTRLLIPGSSLLTIINFPLPNNSQPPSKPQYFV